MAVVHDDKRLVVRAICRQHLLRDMRWSVSAGRMLSTLASPAAQTRKRFCSSRPCTANLFSCISLLKPFCFALRARSGAAMARAPPPTAHIQQSTPVPGRSSELSNVHRSRQLPEASAVAPLAHLLTLRDKLTGAWRTENLQGVHARAPRGREPGKGEAKYVVERERKVQTGE